MLASKDHPSITMIRRFLTAAIAILAAATSHAAEVSDIRVIGDDDRTRFIVDLDKKPEFGVLRLVDPERLVIDLPDVTFRTTDLPVKGRGLVEDYRYGQIAPGKARIVLDLTGPIDIVKTFILDPVDPDPARLVLDLVPTTAEEFAAAAARDRPQAIEPGQSQGPAAAPPKGRRIVVIDPGHGGIDAGATGSDGLLEKDLVLKFSFELVRQLRAAAVEAVLTRNGDTFMSLSSRVDVAHNNHATLFISVHADSAPQDYVRGATVYTLSDEASDALAEAMAAQENRSDILAGLALEDQPDDVADILFDLARRETRNLSVRFAQTLVGELRDNVLLNSNPWRRASFKVLKVADVPSVLLELGYMSNPEDEKLFRSDHWHQDTARLITRAVKEFLENRAVVAQ
jgi:N-acetylmuramoyl-L-alanine amidase